MLDSADLADRLDGHLRSWLGEWPPTGPVTVVGSDRRRRPAWNGAVFPLAGVATPTGAVLSVPPDVADAVRRLDRAATAGSDQTEAAGFTAVEASISRVLAALPGLLGFPDARVGGGVFRWCHTLQEWPDAGEWIDPGDGRVPEWLRPFNGEVLVAWDRHGHYAAGVGRKIHDRHGQEISVGTEAANRGRGLARHLVAQAARRIAEEGAVATYLHRTDNPASARVADVSGFPDEGWKVIGLPAAS